MNTFAKGKYELAINGQTSIYHETSNLIGIFLQETIMRYTVVIIK